MSISTLTKRNWFIIKALFLLVSFTITLTATAAPRVIQLNPNFGKPLRLNEPAKTIAIGDPNIADVVTVEPDLLMITGQKNGSTSMTIIGHSGKIRQYSLLVSDDTTQLQTLIHTVAPNVTVQNIKKKILLKGFVDTPAQLARVLTVADRYMGGASPTPRFRVISDQGGILAGNLPETQFLTLSQLRLNTGGGASGRGGSGGGNGGGGGTASITSKNNKGKANLAQNIARANVISVANGNVISVIKVLSQPRVEIQMRIVEVDRNKTDEFGIDWRLDGNKVSVSSFTGDVVDSLPSPTSNAAVNVGDSNLIGFLINPGSYSLSTFVRALERKGATTTLSEPLLTAISGEASQFLVGGSVPIPVQTQSSSNNTVATATNVQYINFGLAINVRPTVLENGKISMVLEQTISQPDFTNGIQILGAQVPGFTQKTVSTVTESESGETWAVAGLLTEEDRKRLEGVPWISKVPILGNLFKNKNDTVSRNEMIILVNAKRVDEVNSSTQSFSGHGGLEPQKSDVNMEEEQKIKEEINTNHDGVNNTYSENYAPPNKSNTSRVTVDTIENNQKLKELDLQPEKLSLMPTSEDIAPDNENDSPTTVNNQNTLKLIRLNYKPPESLGNQAESNSTLIDKDAKQVVIKYFLDDLEKISFFEQTFDANEISKINVHDWRVATGRLKHDMQHKVFIMIKRDSKEAAMPGSALHALDMGNDYVFTALN